MNAPRFALVIVGDEILSGKREDKHVACGSNGRTTPATIALR